MEPFASRGAEGQCFAERLPADPDFWNENIGIVVTEFFEARGSGKLQGMETGQRIGRTKNRQPGFRVKRVGLPARLGKITRTGADNIAGKRRLIGALFQSFPSELSAKRETYSAGRQIEK